MTKILSCSVVAAGLLVSSAAFAGGSKGSLGVGVNLPLAGGSLPSIGVQFDGGQFHVGGAFGAQNPDGGDNGSVDIMGDFYFHVASTAMSDFGLGGNVVINMDRLGDPTDNNTTNIFLEPGFQIRAFLASNVAIHLTAGLSIGVGDSKDFFLGGDPVGAAGFYYYFE